jgi:hypothetical protein
MASKRSSGSGARTSRTASTTPSRIATSRDREKAAAFPSPARVRAMAAWAVRPQPTFEGRPPSRLERARVNLRTFFLRALCFA